MNTFLIFNSQVFPILQDKVSIGRSLDNQIVIQEPTISRKHAKVIREGDKYYVVDLDSTCGTYINGKKISKRVLNSGDSIMLAGTPMVFVENAPEMNKRATARTGPLFPPGPDNEPTKPEEELDWEKLK